MFDYLRQISCIGEENQGKLKKSKVAIVGCGATGSFSSTLLVRSGIGYLRLIDRDFVEKENLPNNVIFTEEDLGKPKVVVANKKLEKINPDCKIESKGENLDKDNASDLLSGFDLVLDCTDNMKARYVINDFCVNNNILWIYCGAFGDSGMAVPLRGNPCLECFIPKNKEPLEGCEVAGILSSTIAIACGYQVFEALKILTMFEEPSFGKLFSFSLKNNKFEVSEIKTRCEKCGH